MPDGRRTNGPKYNPPKYHLKHRLSINNDVWEYWQGVGECALVRYTTQSGSVDFDAHVLGWDRLFRRYVDVTIPDHVRIGERVLEPYEVEALAARMHIVLCSMKKRNIVAHRLTRPPLPEADRVRVLTEFQQWMEDRGYRVAIDRKGEIIFIKRKLLHLFRRKPLEGELLEFGAWVAKAFHALPDREEERTILFVSEGAPVESWTARVEW